MPDLAPPGPDQAVWLINGHSPEEATEAGKMLDEAGIEHELREHTVATGGYGGPLGGGQDLRFGVCVHERDLARAQAIIYPPVSDEELTREAEAAGRADGLA